MKRQKENYLDKIELTVSFSEKKILEIGCGNGGRSIQIASRCKELIAIEPDIESLAEAKKTNNRANIQYQNGTAEVLNFEKEYFDLVFFTLSLHHVPIGKMSSAINEAIRVTSKGGFIIFLEPFFDGSYFESEILFNAGCGDERAEKAIAYYKMLKQEGYSEVIELEDETVFEIESIDDFVSVFNPKMNLDKLPHFLESNNYTLRAERRINIFKVL